MPDPLHAWQAFCLLLMVAVTVTNHLIEKGSNR